METKILRAALIISIFINLLLAVMVWVHKRITQPNAKELLGWILKRCDKFCDDIEAPATRMQCIMATQSLLGFGFGGKRIFLPTVIVGWIFDAEVAYLRFIGVPDLHQPGKPPEMNSQDSNMRG